MIYDIYLTILVVSERYGGSVRRVTTRRTSKGGGKGDIGRKGIKVRKSGGDETVLAYTG
jgi:hypothetical protein